MGGVFKDHILCDELFLYLLYVDQLYISCVF
jgi:hypothetical protein